MKRCPKCNRVETDDALAFCRADGAALISDSGSISGNAGTAKFESGQSSGEIETSILPHATDANRNRATVRTSVLPPAQPSTSTSDLSKPQTRRTVVILGFSLLTLIAGSIVIGGYFYGTRKSKDSIESIAVLPFENRSGNPDTDYLSDGLAESLIFRLSQLPGLKVSPTTSVMRYKGDSDVAKIAKDLGVDAIMTGRVLQRGDNLNITVELVDVRNNKSLWGEQYERKMSELLATQREIATEIAQKLRLKLSREEKGLTKHYTDNNEAYQLYLKGSHHFAKRTRDDVQRGIEYFRQAVRLDPNFALAYATIADYYNQMPTYPYLSSKEAFPQAKVAAQRALEIDPSVPEAHTALANYFAVYDWNWLEAEREFKRAIELDPNNSAAHFRYGQLYLAPLGRYDEAIREFKRALELEPLSLNTSANLAQVYVFAGQNDRALEQARKTYDLEPNYPVARHHLGLAYIANGMYAEAIALSEKVLQTDPTNQLMLRVAGYAYAKSGRRQEAEEVTKRFKDIAKTQYAMSYFVANIYAALGDKEKAFAELEKAFAERDFSLHRLKVDPLMNPLRDDPRFQDLLRRIGFSP